MNDNNGLALLRQTLAAQAQTVTLPPGLADTVRARARRGAVRRRVAAVAAAVAVMTGAGVTIAQLQTPPRVSVASLVPAWPERGVSAHDTQFVNGALAAWNASTGTQHALRKVLFAGHDSLGPVALLLATDPSGRLHLGGIVGAAAADATPSRVVEDRAVTSPLSAVGFVHRDTDQNQVLIFVTDPAMTSISWSAGGMVDSDSLASGFDVLSFGTDYAMPAAVTVAGPNGPQFVAPIG